MKVRAELFVVFVFLPVFVLASDTKHKNNPAARCAEATARLVEDPLQEHQKIAASLLSARALFFHPPVREFARSISPELQIPTPSTFEDLARSPEAMDAFLAFVAEIKKAENKEALHAYSVWLHRVQEKFGARVLGASEAKILSDKKIFLEIVSAEPLQLPKISSTSRPVQVKTSVKAPIDNDDEVYHEIHAPGYEEMEAFLSVALLRFVSLKEKFSSISSGRKSAFLSAAEAVMRAQISVIVIIDHYISQNPELSGHILEFSEHGGIFDPAFAQSIASINAPRDDAENDGFIQLRSQWAYYHGALKRYLKK